tara:strand:- start:525 stop:959 length:435 start_codon:yes stop_codon:yes gene_type:complete
MPLPPLQQLAVGMPASGPSAYETERRDHLTYLLVARVALKHALADLPRPEDPSAAYNAFKDMYPDGPGPGGGAAYRSLAGYDDEPPVPPVPPPDPEDVRRYKEELLPAYTLRRDRLVANLESVEKELPQWLSKDYGRELAKLLV